MCDVCAPCRAALDRLTVTNLSLALLSDRLHTAQHSTIAITSIIIIIIIIIITVTIRCNTATHARTRTLS